MIIRLNGKTTIENLRNYPAENLEQLRMLLSVGAKARVDPRRKNFYELEDGSRLFYIHICPNGKVLLLAVWDKENSPATRETDISVPAPAFW